MVNQDLTIRTWSTATVRICKIAVHGIGANTTPKAMQQVGKCAGPLFNIIDSESGVGAVSTGHTVPSFQKDLDAVFESAIHLTGI